MARRRREELGITGSENFDSVQEIQKYLDPNTTQNRLSTDPYQQKVITDAYHGMKGFFNLHNDSIYQENKNSENFHKLTAQMSFYDKNSKIKLSDALLNEGSLVSLKDPIMASLESRQSTVSGEEMLI